MRLSLGCFEIFILKQIYCTCIQTTEVEAAQQAGIDVCLLRRPDNPDKEVRSYEWVENFNEISKE